MNSSVLCSLNTLLWSGFSWTLKHFLSLFFMVCVDAAGGQKEAGQESNLESSAP